MRWGRQLIPIVRRTKGASRVFDGSAEGESFGQNKPVAPTLTPDGRRVPTGSDSPRFGDAEDGRPAPQPADSRRTPLEGYTSHVPHGVHCQECRRGHGNWGHRGTGETDWYYRVDGGDRSKVGWPHHEVSSLVNYRIAAASPNPWAGDRVANRRSTRVYIPFLIDRAAVPAKQSCVSLLNGPRNRLHSI